VRKNLSSSIPNYVVALFAICIAILIGNAFSSYQSLQRLKDSSDAIEHSWSIRDHLKQLNLAVSAAESALQSYYLTGNSAFLGPWKSLKKSTDSEFTLLTELVRDNPSQQQYLAQLRALVSQKVAELAAQADIYEAQGVTQTIEAIRAGGQTETMDEIQLLDTIMEKEETALLKARRDHSYREYNRSLWIGNVMNGIAILILLVFFRLIRNNSIEQQAIRQKLSQSNDTLEATVLARTEQLSVLSRHLLRVAEQEKAKLARELHDEMGANLTAVSMALSLIMTKLKKIDVELADRLALVRQNVIDAVDMKRRIIEDLRPSMLDNLGLGAALQSHFEHVTGLAKLQFDADITHEFDHADAETTIAIFRIAQEALTNIVKYANANQVRLSLARKGQKLWLQILDDGIGMPADALTKARTHGLLGMRERALLLGGSFSVASGPENRGTAIDVFLPLPA